MKNDEIDATDLADRLRMSRLPDAYIAPLEVRELRELVRYRAKLVTLRSGGSSTQNDTPAVGQEHTERRVWSADSGLRG